MGEQEEKSHSQDQLSEAQSEAEVQVSGDEDDQVEAGQALTVDYLQGGEAQPSNTSGDLLLGYDSSKELALSNLSAGIEESQEENEFGREEAQDATQQDAAQDSST